MCQAKLSEGEEREGGFAEEEEWGGGGMVEEEESYERIVGPCAGAS